MRIGSNPHKDLPIQTSDYLHQVIIPVYIPNQEGYFKDVFEIFRMCLDSLFVTIHKRTFVTIINNGSTTVVKEYLDYLLKTGWIHEVIHTQNIGKLNAILKGLVGNAIELVTISDADVLFLPNWQTETANIFSKIPKVGVVGIVPQFKMYDTNCGPLLFESFFNNSLRFIPVKNPNALIQFYQSIGWDTNYNPDYLKYSLGYKIEDLTVYCGSGHFVATYKKDMFQEITSYIGYKMGGTSESYLDKIPLDKGYWRVTTYDNYACHMGNTIEKWMNLDFGIERQENNIEHNFKKNKNSNSIAYFIKNKLFVKFISIKWMIKLFLKWKKLPKEMIDKY
ncbi:glycosyltransferase family A protein [Flavobacterium sp. LB2R40]|uniref:glycosyltransferase family A protein n=1 Tax=Flavobacterium sp. LB2R40 TaxID=3401722 RepID=UPI003AAE8507